MQSSAKAVGEQRVGFYNQQSADIVSEATGEPSVHYKRLAIRTPGLLESHLCSLRNSAGAHLQSRGN